MLLFDIVGFFKLFVSLLDFFLEYFVLFIKAVVLFVEIVFFLLDPAFLTGNFSAALFKFLIKLGTALLDLLLCIEKCDLFLIFCFCLCCFDKSFGFLFRRTYRCFSLLFAVVYTCGEEYRSANSETCNKRNDSRNDSCCVQVLDLPKIILSLGGLEQEDFTFRSQNFSAKTVKNENIPALYNALNV